MKLQLFTCSQGIPSFTEMVIHENKEEKHIVRYHAGPGCDNAQAENIDAKVGATDSYEPHSYYAEYKGFSRFTHTMHKAFYYYPVAVKWLG